MSPSSAWPPTTRDRSAMARAYANLLGWKVFVGSSPLQSEAGSADTAPVCNPNALLTVACSDFDAIKVHHKAGMDALVRLDRKSTFVPCLTDGTTATFLVRAGTGQHFEDLGGVQIISGASERVVLPPSPGFRWDTPPWARTERVPLPLREAGVLVTVLREALQFYGQSTGTAPAVVAAQEPVGHELPADITTMP